MLDIQPFVYPHLAGYPAALLSGIFIQKSLITSTSVEDVIHQHQAMLCHASFYIQFEIFVMGISGNLTA